MSGVRDRHLFVFLLAALAVAVPVLWQTTINHDTAFQFLAAERYLSGERLYLDQSLAKPPLITWLFSIPAWAGGALGSIGVNAVFSFVAALIGIGLWLVLRLGGGSVALIAGFLAAAVVPLHVFAEQDHLLLAFAFPYVVLTGMRLDGRSVPWPWAAAIGGFAFFGLALKPHFLLLPLALEAALLIRIRRPRDILRPETVALGSCLAAYAVSVFLLYPEYLATVAPRYVGVFFPFTVPDFLSLIGVPEMVLGLLALVVFILCRNGAETGLFRALAVSVGAATVIYLLQRKGWTYHRLPLFAFATALFTACVAAWPSYVARSQRLGGGLAAAALVAALGLVTVRGPYVNYFYDTLGKEIARLGKGGAVYAFTTNVSVPFPMVVYEDVTWASRFNTLWMIPGLHIREVEGETDGLAAVERFAREAILKDFQRYRPRIVAVDAREPKPYFRGYAFDYLAWALRDSRFAEEWKAYEFSHEFSRFRFYVRSSEGAGPDGQ